MTDVLRPGFPLRLNSELFEKKDAAPPPQALPQDPPIHREEEEEEYLLKWGEHNNQVINIFHQLCQDKELCDVTLATETKSYSAHKLVLAACSPYFRALFAANPCKHPTVFFRDISADQMDLLMEYMYRGRISVKQSSLESILRTASSLQIHGLTTPTDSPAPPSNTERDETGSQHSSASSGGDSGGGKRRADGRKSSKPKKLRLNSAPAVAAPAPADTETSPPLPQLAQLPPLPQLPGLRESPMFSMMNQISQMSPRLTPAAATDKPRASPEPVLEPSLASASDDNIAASDSEENELVIDQPMDFSNTASTPLQKENQQPKQRKLKTKSLDSLKMSTPLLGTWEEQLANLAKAGEKTQAKEAAEADTKEGDISVTANTAIMGMDIAAQLKSHFLASLPSQSYAWLNGLSGLGAGAGQGGGAPPNTPQEGDKIRERTGLGGIKTGEIGPNGKPSVECEDCGKVLADPSSLYRHRKIHTGEKPHKCPYCDKRFIQRYNMKQHIKTHRMDPEDVKIHMDLTPKVEAISQLKLPIPNFGDNGLNVTH